MGYTYSEELNFLRWQKHNVRLYRQVSKEVIQCEESHHKTWMNRHNWAFLHSQTPEHNTEPEEPAPNKN